MSRRVVLPTVIEVSPDHVLSRVITFDHPVQIKGHDVYSIEELFWSCCLAQHNMFTDAKDFWQTHSAVRGNPAMIADSVNGYFNYRHVDFLAPWVLNVKNVMRKVLLEILDRDGSPIKNALKRTCERFGQHVYFVEVNGSKSERVWSSGERPNRLPRDIADYRGANLYGEVLTEVYRWFVNADSLPNWLPSVSIGDLLTRSYLSHEPYRKTVVIISDSIMRHVREVQGGEIWYQGGLTCGQLANAIRSKLGDLKQFKYVIIAAGTNDSMLRDRDRRGSWDDMRSLLEPLRRIPYSTVIFNTGIGAPGWPYVPEYTRWFRRAFDNAFGDLPNFHLLDWSIPHPANLFLYRNGDAYYEYFDCDGLHPNLSGTRGMWRQIQSISSPTGCDLRAISLDTSTDIYRAPTLRDRPNLL